MSPSSTAPEFFKYLQGERARIAKTFTEVEEIQKEYQGQYAAFKAAHDKTLRELAEQIQAAPDSVEAQLRRAIDARVPDEAKWVANRIAQLDRNITEGTQLADNLVKRAQKEQNDLAVVNPNLNEREEALKTDLARWQQTLDDLNARVKRLAAGLGFIFNAWSIHQLDRERFRALGRVEGLAQELNKIRIEWRDLRAMVVEEEGDWQAQWQQAVARTGELRAERESLAQNADAVARRRATTFVLDNLKTPATAKPPLDAALRQMVDLNIQTDDYKTALGAIAGILGTAKGIDDGLGRFCESVKALMDEQNRHSQYLAQVKISLSDTTVAFGKNWDALASKAHDEKALANHPKEFVALMQPFIDRWLTTAVIGDYFNTLGAALQQSTAGWKG